MTKSIEQSLTESLDNLDLDYNSEVLLDEGIKDMLKSFGRGATNAVNAAQQVGNNFGDAVGSDASIIRKGCLIFNPTTNEFIGIPDVDPTDKDIVSDVLHNYPGYQIATPGERGLALQNQKQVKILQPNQVKGNSADAYFKAKNQLTNIITPSASKNKGKRVLMPTEVATQLKGVVANLTKAIEDLSKTTSAPFQSTNTQAANSTAVSVNQPNQLIGRSVSAIPNSQPVVGAAAALPGTGQTNLQPPPAPIQNQKTYTNQDPKIQGIIDKWNPKNKASGQITESPNGYNIYDSNTITKIIGNPDGSYTGTQLDTRTGNITAVDPEIIKKTLPGIVNNKQVQVESRNSKLSPLDIFED